PGITGERIGAILLAQTLARRVDERLEILLARAARDATGGAIDQARGAAVDREAGLEPIHPHAVPAPPNEVLPHPIDAGRIALHQSDFEHLDHREDRVERGG